MACPGRPPPKRGTSIQRSSGKRTAGYPEAFKLRSRYPIGQVRIPRAPSISWATRACDSWLTTFWFASRPTAYFLPCSKSSGSLGSSLSSTAFESQLCWAASATSVTQLSTFSLIKRASLPGRPKESIGHEKRRHTRSTISIPSTSLRTPRYTILQVHPVYMRSSRGICVDAGHCKLCGAQCS